jgi:hypothetical protein
MSLLRRHAKPRYRLRGVPRDAESVGVCDPEVEPGLEMSLPGGLSKPLRRLDMILRDAFPVAICRREAELGGGIPLFGLPPEGVRVTGAGR